MGIQSKLQKARTRRGLEEARTGDKEKIKIKGKQKGDSRKVGSGTFLVGILRTPSSIDYIYCKHYTSEFISVY